MSLPSNIGHHTPIPHCSRTRPTATTGAHPSSPLSKPIDSDTTPSSTSSSHPQSSPTSSTSQNGLHHVVDGVTLIHQPKPENGKVVSSSNTQGKRRGEPHFIPMPNSSKMIPNPHHKKPINPTTLSPLPSPLPFFGGTIVFLPAPPPSSSSTPSSASSSHHAPPVPHLIPNSPSSTPSQHIPPSSLSLRCHARARIPTPHGPVFLHLYKTAQDNKEHLAIVFDPAQIDSTEQEPGHIRSRSLDAVWREGETEMERLIRGAYVGRLSEKGGKASVGKERLVEGFEQSRPSTPAATAAATLSGSGTITPGGGAAPTTSPSNSPPSSPRPQATKRQLNPPLIRIHSECFTGETIGSQRCDCGEQLDESLRIISLPSPLISSHPETNGRDGSSSSAFSSSNFMPTSDASSSDSASHSTDNPPPIVPGRGVIVYLRQEGRGIGLLSKLLAYNLQDLGHDTVSANIALGHGADERKWDVAGGILRDLGFGANDEGSSGESVRLMTNNPDKVEGLRGEGVKVVERVGMVPRAWPTYPHRDRKEPLMDEEGEFPELSESLESQLHPEIKALEREARQTDREKREWLARKAGVGMIGGGETRSVELDRYLRTKVERMGHILELPKD